jgi:hypothetical protein
MMMKMMRRRNIEIGYKHKKVKAKDKKSINIIAMPVLLAI